MATEIISRNDVFEEVVDIIADQFGINVLEINADTVLGDLGDDSLDMLEIATGVEDSFGVYIEAEDIQLSSTVGQLACRVADMYFSNLGK